MSLSRERRHEWNSWEQLMQEEPQVNLCLTPYGGMRYAFFTDTQHEPRVTLLMKHASE
jgi:hypothetical protein